MSLKKVVGGLLFVVGSIFVAGTQAGITGNVISSQGGSIGSVLGVLLVGGGLVLACGK
ncbi:MAG: hypothetical protein ACE5ES_02400 [Candidatus Nanoarchaeia archaeon]